MIRSAAARIGALTVLALLTSLIVAPQAAHAETIPYGNELRDIAFAPDGQYAYTVDRANGTLGRVNLADNTATTLLSGIAAPRSVTVTPDNERIIVGTSGQIFMIDPQNPSTDDSVLTYNDMDSVTATATTAYATAVNGRTWRLTKGGGGWPTAASWTIGWLGGGVTTRGIAASADDSILLIGNEGGSMYRILDPATCTAPCTASTVPNTGTYGSQGIAIDPSGTFAYYAANSTGAFYRLDLATDAVTAISGSAGAGARDVAFTPDGAFAYSVFIFSSRIQKIRTSDHTVGATLNLPGTPQPMSVATSPVTGADLMVTAGANGGGIYRYPSAAAAPTSLSAAYGDESATISFTPGSDELSAITNYEYSLDGTTWTALSPADATSPVTITGLPNGVAQSITLRAINGVGPGTASSAVSVTPMRVPNAPSITGFDWDDTTVTLDVAPPADNGGSAITSYEYSTDAGANWTARGDGGGSASPIVISGLTTGTTYTFDVRAVNSVGAGAMTSSSVTVTPGAPHTPPPPPPTYPADAPTTVTAVGGARDATVTWLAPASSGSFPISTYQAVASPGGATCLTRTTSCTIAGLVPGSTYTFTVRALNGAGWSAYSAASAPLTLAPAPSPATINISGGRSSGRLVVVSGSVTGTLDGVLRPRIAYDGRRGVSLGRSIEVRPDGTFDWRRRLARAATITFTAGESTSNAIRVKAFAKSGRG